MNCHLYKYKQFIRRSIYMSRNLYVLYLAHLNEATSLTLDSLSFKLFLVHAQTKTTLHTQRRIANYWSAFRESPAAVATWLTPNLTESRRVLKDRKFNQAERDVEMHALLAPSDVLSVTSRRLQL